MGWETDAAKTAIACLSHDGSTTAVAAETGAHVTEHVRCLFVRFSRFNG